ncbi:MAG: YebC/PmpR family DNA-binding transcriptional regulator [Verrucomicrobiota bacterium]
MAGHNKWSQIKHKKAANDQKRGKIFSKLGKEITVAAKMGGGDPNLNPRLRSAISAAKSEGMPADNIERARKKGTGELEGGNIEELSYEGYGPGGIALLVETATDNKNRTAADVRSIFSKNNGNMAGAGSVAWMFHKKAYFFVENGDEEKIFETTCEAGAEEIQSTDGGIEIYSPFESYDKVEKALDEAGIRPEISRITYIPENTTSVNDESTARQIMSLIDKLEDCDDVQNVHANFDISDEIMATITE